MTLKFSEHQIFRGQSKLSLKLHNYLNKIRGCSINQLSPHVHLHVRWQNNQSWMLYLWLACLLKIFGTNNLETGWKLKLTSSTNMIDMLWELLKMDWLSNTFHVKYRKYAYIEKVHSKKCELMSFFTWPLIHCHPFCMRRVVKIRGSWQNLR